MPKTTTGLATTLGPQLERLASFEPTRWPVLSLYLDMRPDQHGRDNYDTFLRKALPGQHRTLQGEARSSFDTDVARINEYLAREKSVSANGLALFACSRADNFFEAVQLEVPVDHHWLFVAPVPHLYPLARLTDQYPRYAALVADTNTARLFVFSLGRPELREQIANEKTRKNAVGGWSQARYQRHIQNIHVQHMKEVVTVLDRVVREEAISQVVLACDEVARPMLMDQLPKYLAEKVVDVVSLDIRSPDHVVLAETMDVLRQRDAESDAERVEELLDASRAGGLGVVGPDATLQALEMGQVEELLLSASPEAMAVARSPEVGASAVEVQTSAPAAQLDIGRLALAGRLVTRAHQNGSRLRFIEDQSLLADVGGVGATLRFRI